MIGKVMRPKLQEQSILKLAGLINEYIKIAIRQNRCYIYKYTLLSLKLQCGLPVETRTLIIPFSCGAPKFLFHRHPQLLFDVWLSDIEANAEDFGFF